MRTAVILGAGFSANSGLPVQSQIPRLLTGLKKSNEMENTISEIILRFLKSVYGFGGCDYYPNLDDIFTCIDISTNSGHHLGLEYSAQHLRAIRRMLVYRVFSILESCYNYDIGVEAFIRSLLEKSSEVDFIVLNWDTVLEKYLIKMMPDFEIEYRNDGILWGEGEERKSGALLNGKNRIIKVLKLHGSSNWLYCDNCRSLYYDLFDDVSLIKKAGFQRNDLNIFPELKKFESELFQSENCMVCQDRISSHIATFRYRKSFRTNSFPSVWDSAEEVLNKADRWVFIGYSLPDADYEFKHLLKIAQLKTAHIVNKQLSIDLVLESSENTVDKYRCFFGDKLGVFCNEGLKGYVDKIKKL